MSQIKLNKFREFIGSHQDFLDKVIEPSKDMVGDMSWLQDAPKYYSMKLISGIIRNKFNERYVLYEEEEFLGYFINKFIQYTPMFYSKVSNIIEDKLSELQINKNVGRRTTIESISDKSESTTPYNNEHADGDVANGTQKSTYEQGAFSENILENAISLSASKISGEIELYVNVFDVLFSSIDLGNIANLSSYKTIVGPEGKEGKTGQPGKDGKTGPAGKDGIDGKDGKDGKETPTENIFTSGSDNNDTGKKVRGVDSTDGTGKVELMTGDAVAGQISGVKFNVSNNTEVILGNSRTLGGVLIETDTETGKTDYVPLKEMLLWYKKKVMSYDEFRAYLLLDTQLTMGGRRVSVKLNVGGGNYQVLTGRYEWKDKSPTLHGKFILNLFSPMGTILPMCVELDETSVHNPWELTTHEIDFDKHEITMKKEDISTQIEQITVYFDGYEDFNGR